MSPYVYDMSMTLLNIRVWHRSNEQLQIFRGFLLFHFGMHDLFLQPWVVALLIATKQSVKKLW